MIFLEQYKDFLVLILIIAAIVSAFMKDVESCAVILVVITMNGLFWVQFRPSRLKSH